MTERIDLAELLSSRTPKLSLVYRCHMFYKLLRYYTSSPISVADEPMIHRVESALVFYLLDTSTHYIRHPHRYLHRFKYCLKCKSLHHLPDPVNRNPSLLTEACYKCEPLEGWVRKGKGSIHYVNCYNPMIAVYHAADLEFRKALDLVLESY